jgi:hypothetical protein
MPSILGGGEVIADALVFGTPDPSGVDWVAHPPSKTVIRASANSDIIDINR